MDKVEFGKYLENIRKYLEMNATEFSRLIGVQRQTWRNWERGRGLNEEKMIKIETMLDNLFKNNPELEINFQHKEFGEFLHNMRTSVGWKAEQMGGKLGYHRTTIERWEKGKSLSQIDDLYLLEQQIRQVVKDELQQRRLTLLVNN